MTFADIPAGVSLFLDANTLVYYFSLEPQFGPASNQLLLRIARQEIVGFTSAHVLSDVAHRMMTVEAIDVWGWPAAGIAQRLRRHHGEIPRLSRFRQAVHDVPQFGVQVLSTTQQHVTDATVISQQYELLSGDGLVVAVMQAHGLTNLASHDSDFDRVPGTTRYSPV